MSNITKSLLAEGEFPGIYTWALAPRIWLSDNVHIVMSTFWRSHTAVVVINVDNGIVTRLQPGMVWYCWLFNYVNNDIFSI